MESDVIVCFIYIATFILGLQMVEFLLVIDIYRELHKIKAKKERDSDA